LGGHQSVLDHGVRTGIDMDKSMNNQLKSVGILLKGRLLAKAFSGDMLSVLGHYSWTISG